MKRIFIITYIILLILPICSCMDTKVLDIDNIKWIDEYFKIEATSNQLKKQFYEERKEGDDNYYSTIVISDNSYSCKIYLANEHFSLTLYDSLNDSVISFYGNSQEFLWGSYELSKEKNKEYIYSIKIKLTDECGYYDYCLENNLDYPVMIVLYGYEFKEIN